MFAQVGSSVDAELYLARVRARHPGAIAETWPGGRAVAYGDASQPSIAWDDSGAPYAAVAASDSRATLATWWVDTGRVASAAA